MYDTFGIFISLVGANKSTVVRTAIFSFVVWERHYEGETRLQIFEQLDGHRR